jgi:TRAP-type C4-dicarboxylate transport system permease small subunit
MTLRDAVLRGDALLAKGEAAVIAVLVAALTAVTAAQVVNRYVLNAPLIWSEEAARYLFVWVSMIGAALAMHQGGHFGLVVLLRRLSPRAHAVIGAFVTFVVVVFLVTFLVTGIRETMLASYQMSLTLSVGMQWPYLALPVSAALMLLHVLAHLVRYGWGMHLLDANSHMPVAPIE